MKTIKIKRLTLENFKCHKQLTLEFLGADVSIYGDNATGKTSIYDALTWLLFGKDSHGNGEKNIEIKPLNEFGEVRDRLAITAVEAVLLVESETEGFEVTLRRTYREVWTTKRGSTEETYDGNTSEYYIDGVPVKKFAFSDKVNELVDEDTFRMLTSVSHLASGISWQERRAVLFRVADVLSDREILSTDERFHPILEGMGKLSLDDYKKKLLSEKRGFVVTKSEIPARINECQKTIEDIECLDFDAARAAIGSLSAKREALEAEVLALEHDTAQDNKRMEIREARLELTSLISENIAHHKAQTANAPDITTLNSRVSYFANQLSARQRMLTIEENHLERLDAEIASARERWMQTHGEVFHGGVCPTCGQSLPASELKEAMAAFDANKSARLREIEQTANANKAAKTQAEERILNYKKEIESLTSELDAARKQLSDAEAFSSAIEVKDIDGFLDRRNEIEKRIQSLESDLAAMAENRIETKGGLIRKLQEIKSEESLHRETVSRESLLEYSRNRIKELTEDARNASAALEAIEKVIYLIEDFTRYKTRFIEDSINGLFRIARFRLFREQANGGIEDRCDVVYDGVPYIGLNSGSKINVGIDIINTLSGAFGVRVPLFIDNAESVTRLEDAACQTIRLVVSENDKEIRLNYEN